MRRATIALVAAAAMLIVSCGSTETSAGAGFVDEGDNQPEGETTDASVVSVTVDIPDGVELAGTAIVALEDITYADAEAVEIGRVELPAAELAQQDNRVELFLPLPLDGSIDVTVTVHIDVDENGTFSQGDWISPELAMVTPDSTSGVTVAIVQI